MARLMPLSDITAQHSDVLGNDYYDPTGQTAYGMNGDKIGTIRGALAEPETGKIRYLIVDVCGCFQGRRWAWRPPPGSQQTRVCPTAFCACPLPWTRPGCPERCWASRPPGPSSGRVRAPTDWPEHPYALR